MVVNLIFLVIAAIATGVIYLAAEGLSLWWLLPVFLGAFVGAVILFLLLLYLFSILFLSQRKKVEKPKAGCAYMIWLVMYWVMSLCRVRVKLVGKELLPDEPCVLVSNHISDFDPMTMLAVLRGRKIAYISKEANFKIPIVGNFIHHAGFLAIDRGNGMRALRTLKQAAEMIKAGSVDIMGIYPEGTRSKNGELLRFKAGAFILAKRAEAPVVVMTTKGTNALTKNFPFRSTQVELKILSVIEKETVASLQQEEISAMVREMIERELGRGSSATEKEAPQS